MGGYRPSPLARRCGLNGVQVDDVLTYEIMSSAERAALITLTLHERLVAEGHPDLARLAWVVYTGAARSAEKMGAHLGVDVQLA